MSKMPSQEELNRLFSYDPSTGILTRKISRTNNVAVGDPVGSNNGNGYLRTSIYKKDFYVHRIVWKMIYNLEPDAIDHGNHKKSDNRLANLSGSTHGDNHKNILLKANNTSGICGVFFHKKARKWQASIKLNGSKSIYLGIYDTIFEAAAVRIKANYKYNFHSNHGKTL